MTPRFMSLLAVPGIALLSAVVAQEVPTLRLTSAPARLDDGFSWISSVRELADGRVLASVSPKPSFVVLDFTSGSIDEVSREGSGPGEYRGEVGPLHALGGDSTLAPAGEGRWLVLDGTTPVHMISAWQRGMAGMSATLAGADASGHLLEVEATGTARSQARASTSTPRTPSRWRSSFTGARDSPRKIPSLDDLTRWP